jgi:hypothetical protein
MKKIPPSKPASCGVYLKKSEPILLPGEAGGRAKTEPLFRPPRQKAEAERTISSFSRAIARKENHN